jgi:uncharacterized protein YegL
MKCSLLQVDAIGANSTKCAVQICPPKTDETRHTATHFIIVIDVSESMLESNKLEDVKHSASLVLHFLGETDKLSIITFGSNASVHVSAMKCSAANKTLIESTIQSIQADGSTNLSSGLVSIKMVLEEEDRSMKTGVIVLTDGYTNRGVKSSAGLLEILDQIRQFLPTLTFQFVGYGTDHNAELLKKMAQHVQGSYSIVENKEGAASVIGDTLGSLFSCVAQMVSLECPIGTSVHGPYTMKNSTTIEIGDIYSGNDLYILLDIPNQCLVQPVRLHGISLPSLNTFLETATPIPYDDSIISTDSYKMIALTYLRYKCSTLFKTLRDISSASAAQKELLKAEIEAFKMTLSKDIYDSIPLAQLLRDECKSLEEAFKVVAYSYINNNDIMSRITQHEAFTSLGRGTSQPIRGFSAGSVDYITSPNRSQIHRRVTELMTSMSCGGEDPSSVMAANEISQMPNEPVAE